MKYLTLILMSAVLLSACVSKKKYMELQSEKQQLEQQYNTLEANHTDLNREAGWLRTELADVEEAYKTEREKHEQLLEEYQTLREQYDQNTRMSESEVNKLNAELRAKIAQLEASNKRVEQLEAAVQRQQQAVADLLGKIKKALLGFSAEELTVTEKDGKVYVSLSENLLFKSASTAVDPKGKEALGKLAEVLKKQPEIDIMIEGHTDNVPLKGSGNMKDNWDLSVLRATSIVRILTDDYGVSDRQIVPAGRGEYFPVATNETREGRAQNRRTEIILSPNLDEIMQMIKAAG